MTFTSNLFLIGSLPWLLLLLYLTGKREKTKKILLLVANMVFCILWGGAGAFVFVCGYAVMIWGFALVLARLRGRALFVLTIVLALMPLVLCKYAHTAIQSIGGAVNFGGWDQALLMPIGISFYTFEAVSLLCDIHCGKIDQQPSLLRVFLYLTLFMTISSGPITRYADFEEGLYSRPFPEGRFLPAAERIMLGLCKKVLIADKIAILADYYFDGTAAGNHYSCAGLWLGSVAYTLQLYFDFSGYSDMAIGMGELFGFRLCENFDRPYQAKSISAFWRRWHISLSRWFRDYVYIPLGGSRCSWRRHILNLLVVWVLTGIWHGADRSFLLWGLGYCFLLILEKYVRFMKHVMDRPIGHLYTLFFVNLLWVPFRAENIGTAGRFIGGMFGFGAEGGIEDKGVRFLPCLLVVLLCCLFWDRVRERISRYTWFRPARAVSVLLLSFLAVCAVINASYSPYIYGVF